MKSLESIVNANLPQSALQTVDRSPAPRLEAVDLLRGTVMIIMALDHVRDFFSNRLHEDPTDMATTSAEIFLTRWITHYCAPTFIFLAGTGAYLSGMRGKSRPELAWFLFTRGLWLALFELTYNRVAWMFNFDPMHHAPGVFWAIGMSMVVLSCLVFLPTYMVTIFGVVMIASHNLLDGLSAQEVHLPQLLWTVLHQPREAKVVGEITFGTGYFLIPWMGVMAAGYGFGSLLRLDQPVRRKAVILLGAALTLGFVLVRYANIYGDPSRWAVQPRVGFTILSFLNCTKYPPSLLYLLMTLGPAIMFLGIFDRPLGPWVKPVIVFGRVPFFFYLLHIPLIHGSAVLLDYLRFGWSPQAFDGPWAVRPEQIPPPVPFIDSGGIESAWAVEKGLAPSNYGVDLFTVYMIWIVVILLLYPLCHWFAEVKRRHRDVALLSYL
jgi:uncharacterized membrane protein